MGLFDRNSLDCDDIIFLIFKPKNKIHSQLSLQK